jgi:hypothetical protein
MEDIPMKCVLLIASGQITRLNNEFAARLVAQGQAHYISKAEWKSAGRPVDKVKTLKEASDG